MYIDAKINSFSYRPVTPIKKFTEFDSLNTALSGNSSTFLLHHPSHQKFAVSRWVSPKRTRSYPYARVYNTLSINSSTKKVTIIPILKDEGRNGDRDFLQYDTISLMNLFGVYVILTYYESAEPSRLNNKITSQKFDIQHLEQEFAELATFSNSAMDWNKCQVSQSHNLATIALEQYELIGNICGVEMHSYEKGLEILHRKFNDPDSYVSESRRLAQSAQRREIGILHAEENVSGTKALVTISDHLGGVHYWTADEWNIDEEKLCLVEAKHTKRDKLPALDDIKDGLVKMMMFSNIDVAVIGDIPLMPHGVLKLTSDRNYSKSDLNHKEINLCKSLIDEAAINGFSIELPEQIT